MVVISGRTMEADRDSQPGRTVATGDWRMLTMASLAVRRRKPEGSSSLSLFWRNIRRKYWYNTCFGTFSVMESFEGDKR